MNYFLAYFYASIEDFLFARNSCFSQVIVLFKKRVPVFIFLFFLFHSSLQAQYQAGTRNRASDYYYQTQRYTGNSRNTMRYQASAAYKKPLYIALKNNLLYDAALLPNLTAEVYLGNKWSLAVEGNGSWWLFKKPVQNEWFHRIQSAGIELRNWVCSPYPLYGHAVGVYGMIGNYDVRAFTKDENSKGWLSYHSWSAGITYAYSIPVSSRFNLEFGIALGYVGGTYYEYNYCMIDEWWAQQAVHERHYFGPTRAGISLVWLIGKGNPARRWQIDQILGK